MLHRRNFSLGSLVGDIFDEVPSTQGWALLLVLGWVEGVVVLCWVLLGVAMVPHAAAGGVSGGREVAGVVVEQDVTGL